MAAHMDANLEKQVPEQSWFQFDGGKEVPADDTSQAE